MFRTLPDPRARVIARRDAELRRLCRAIVRELHDSILADAMARVMAAFPGTVIL